PRNDGKTCVYQAPSPGPFNITVAYSDAPDADAVAKVLKVDDAQTFFTDTPVRGLGDAAIFSHVGTATVGSLPVFVAGTIRLTLVSGPLDQLRAVAQKALRGNGATGFAYNSNGDVPNLAKPATPSVASASPLDQLKADLAKKANAGDATAALTLANLYQFGNN